MLELNRRSAVKNAFVNRPQKITLGELREIGIRGLLIYCSDCRGNNNIAISGERWPDHVRLSDLEPLFTCTACGLTGADAPIKGNFNWEQEQATKNPVQSGGLAWTGLRGRQTCRKVN